MRLALAAVLVAAVLAAPSAASAATFDVQDMDGANLVVFEGDPDVGNEIQVTGTPRAFVVTVADEISTPNIAPCVVGDEDHTLTCTDDEPMTLSVLGGDGADTITSSATGFAVSSLSFMPGILRIDGGEGVDTIEGGPAGEYLESADGADTVRGNGGDDLMIVRASGVSFDGGAGTDTISNRSPLAFDAEGDARPMSVRLNGAAPTTGNGFPGQALTLRDVETVYGGPGHDTLVGSAAAETLVGLGGGDTIDGGAGIDFLYGTVGSGMLAQEIASAVGVVEPAGPARGEAITSQDGAIDLVNCGPGPSTLVADDADLLQGCPPVGGGTTIVPVPRPLPPTVQVPVPVPGAPVGVPTPVLDTTKATIGGFTAAGTVKGQTIRKDGRYRVAFTTNEPVTGSVALLAKAGKVATIAAAGDLQLAAKDVTAGAGRKVTVNLTIAKRLRRLLRKGRRFTVVVTLVDRGGNTTTRRRTVKVG